MNNNNDDDVRALWGLPLRAAAARCGMSPSTFRRFCRQRGVRGWPRRTRLLCEYEALVYWERECLAARDRLWARFHDVNAQLREVQALMDPRASVVACFFGDDA